MSAVLDNNLDNFDEVFNNIARLYDRAENILRVVHHEAVENPDQFVEEIELLVRQIEESANVIAADFSAIIESGQEPTNAMKIRVNSALRKILLAIDEYRNHFKDAEV